MDDSAFKLKNYIEEISLLQEKDPSDLKSLKKCYKDYKLSDDELDKLEVISMNHLRRSEELLKEKKINGSISSMERAVEINPFSDEFRNKMAQLYLMRAHREGFKKIDRDLAFNSASISMELNKNNPIAKSIIKEIQTKDDKLSGKDLNKKLLPVILIIFVIVLFAVFRERKYFIPLFTNNSTTETEEWIKPVPNEIIPFSELEIETQINSFYDDFDVFIEKSLISKTNGSYSYNLHGEISAPEEIVKTLDLDINFINNDGSSLFKRTIPLVSENQLVRPGEVILLDEFFYIHYLPPDINRVNLNLTNISFSDEDLPAETVEELYLEWDTFRPEGIKIEMSLRDESAYESYAGSFKDLKIQLKNLGTIDIEKLEIKLSWKNKYGDILFETPETLISEENPPLLTGKNRIYFLFCEIPNEVNDDDNELYIRINRIN